MLEEEKSNSGMCGNGEKNGKRRRENTLSSAARTVLKASREKEKEQLVAQAGVFRLLK